MNGLMIRDPFELGTMARVFDRFFNDPAFGVGERAAMPEIGALALDVSEDDASIIVRASLPGFAREDVHIETHQGVLTISASKTEEREERGERYHRRERRTGSVSRSVALPESVVEDRAEAELKDGVLTLRLPKAPQAQKRKISIK